MASVLVGELFYRLDEFNLAVKLESQVNSARFLRGKKR